MSAIVRASPAVLLRHTLLWASRRRRVQRLITAAPVARSLVRRFVAGEAIDDAVSVTRALRSQGLTITLDHLGEDIHDAGAARTAVDVYTALVRRLDGEGLTDRAEVSVKLSAVGQALDEQMAIGNAAEICAAARAAHTTVTIDMEDHTTTDATLHAVVALRASFPETGAVLQASLHRTEADCTALARSGSRVRLCKGAYQEPPSMAFLLRDEVRSSFLRCLRILITGNSYPMVATHDPLLIRAAAELFGALSTPGAGHEYQMLYGIRPDEQLRLARGGEMVRVYVPFGDQWYSYMMRRLAERPSNLALVLRALRTRS